MLILNLFGELNRRNVSYVWFGYKLVDNVYKK